jgi:hypothetical protein
MKKPVLFAFLILFWWGTAGIAGATLTTIGTATYVGTDYNLIYEDDQLLVWLDYTKDANTWVNQSQWASELGGSLTIILDPGYTTTIDWSTGWRLPSAGDNPQAGYNQTSSEMGHLYYESLGKNPGGPLGETDPFQNLYSAPYWSGTEYSGNTGLAWYFLFQKQDGRTSSIRGPNGTQWRSIPERSRSSPYPARGGC